MTRRMRAGRGARASASGEAIPNPLTYPLSPGAIARVGGWAPVRAGVSIHSRRTLIHTGQAFGVPVEACRPPAFPTNVRESP